MNNYQWRTAQLSDAPNIVSMFKQAEAVDPRIQPPDISNIEHTIQRILSFPQGDMIVVHHQEQLIAMALIMMRPENEQTLVHCRGHVHVHYRRQGLGTELLEWASQQAKNLHQPSSSPLQIVTTCRGFMADYIALFESQNFEASRHQIKMQRNLRDALPKTTANDNVTIALWTAEQDESMRTLFNLAFENNWGVPHLSGEAWRQRFIETPQFRSDLTYLAYANEQLIAFCLTEQYKKQADDPKKVEAWMEAIGVHPEWRGQGIATRLMCHAMNNYLAQGFTHAGLDVDAQNWSNVIALYKKLGFYEVSREIFYAKII